MRKFNPKSLLNLDQTKHGMCETPTWKSWTSMIRRCRGNNDKAKWYADRGIGVCYRWRSFENFYADMGERPAGTTLDRIDNNKGYQPGNCRWADRVTQGSNKRNNVYLEFRGRRQTLSAWSRELGISKEGIKKRIAAGMSKEDVFTSKKHSNRSGWFGDSAGHAKAVRSWRS